MIYIPAAIAYPVFDLSEILERTAGQNIGVPWEALKVDAVKKEFILNVEKSRLENATGFDKDNWPEMARLLERRFHVLRTLFLCLTVEFSF